MQYKWDKTRLHCHQGTLLIITTTLSLFTQHLSPGVMVVESIGYFFQLCILNTEKPVMWPRSRDGLKMRFVLVLSWQKMTVSRSQLLMSRAQGV